MENMKFENLEGNNLNRKRLAIVSQSADEMVVDVFPAWEKTKGTAITSEIMQQIYDSAKNASDVSERVSAIEAKLESATVEGEALNINADLIVSGNIYLS